MIVVSCCVVVVAVVDDDSVTIGAVLCESKIVIAILKLVTTYPFYRNIKMFRYIIHCFNIYFF